MRQLATLLTGAVLLIAACVPAPTTAQPRPAGMDTDEFGNLKRSIDRFPVAEPHRPVRRTEGRRPKRSEPQRQRSEKSSSEGVTRSAVQDRQRRCGAQWRRARDAGTLVPEMTWPRYWSECNARLKRSG